MLGISSIPRIANVGSYNVLLTSNIIIEFHNPPETQGTGAANATTAHTAMHVPWAELHVRIAAGAVGAATVPKIQPAAA